MEVLQFYGHRVQHAQYSKRQVDRLGKEFVSQTWEVIAATQPLAGLLAPRKTPKYQASIGLDI